MAKTLHKLSEEDMQAVADKLVGLKIGKARGQIRRLDPDSQLQMYRVGVQDELLTRFVLPNLGVSITLVEEPGVVAEGDADKLKATDSFVKFKATDTFVEARIEALV
jgi:hypothetical protein